MEGIWGKAVWGPLRELGQQAVASFSSLIGMLILILVFRGLGVTCSSIGAAG
jgi:hypothetical protein